jgi:hypothetical protein
VQGFYPELNSTAKLWEPQEGMLTMSQTIGLHRMTLPPLHPMLLLDN